MKKPETHVLDKITKHLRYEGGRLFWVGIYNGREAGAVMTHGYITVGLFRKLYYAHHIVWFLCNGEWPTTGLDHIDRNKKNNNIENLRLATPSQNNINCERAIGRTGVRGVWLDDRYKTIRYKAYLKVNGKCRWLGTFDNLADASICRKNGEARFHGEFSPNKRVDWNKPRAKK